MFNKQGQQISARKTTESSELSLLLRVLGSFGTALGFRKSLCFWCVLLLFIAKNPVNMCLSREARRRRIFFENLPKCHLGDTRPSSAEIGVQAGVSVPAETCNDFPKRLQRSLEQLSAISSSPRIKVRAYIISWKIISVC